MYAKEAWFELVFLRTDATNKLAGGFSGLLKGMLLTFFGQTSHNMEKSGISLTLADGSHHLVFMRLACFVADEAALHYGYCNKGASGLKPCILCANVFHHNLRHEIVERDTTGMAQHHTTHDASKLKFHTPQSIASIVHRLSNSYGTLSKAQFTELERTLGWNYSPHGVMWNPITRPLVDPSSIAAYDWMHVVFVSGVFGVTLGQVMRNLKDEGVTYAVLHNYIQKFTWPAHTKKIGKEACIPERARSSWANHVFKCSASEGLSLAPVFENFFSEFIHRHPSPSALAKGIASNFLQLLGVVHLIVKCRSCDVSPLELQKAIKDFVYGYGRLHGPDTMIIKFHLLLHLPFHLKKYGFLPNCFVHERKHKCSKRFANNSCNTDAGWEGALLREITCHHLYALQNEDDNRFGLEPALVNASPPAAKLLAALTHQFGPGDYTVASSARLASSERVSVGDVVLYRGGAGKLGMLVKAKVHGDDITAALLNGFTHVRKTRKGDEWQMTDTMQICLLSAITGAVVWSEVDGRVLTLNPL